MPGRPRTTLKRLDDLLVRTAAVGDTFLDLMPARYVDNCDPRDPIGMAWQSAMEATVNNYRALYALRELVAGKVERAERLNKGTGGGM